MTAREKATKKINTSATVREDGAVESSAPCLAISARGDMQVEHDIGDLGKTQDQEPRSKRLKEGDVAKDLYLQIEAVCGGA